MSVTGPTKDQLADAIVAKIAPADYYWWASSKGKPDTWYATAGDVKRALMLRTRDQLFHQLASM